MSTGLWVGAATVGWANLSIGTAWVVGRAIWLRERSDDVLAAPPSIVSASVVSSTRTVATQVADRSEGGAVVSPTRGEGGPTTSACARQPGLRASKNLGCESAVEATRSKILHKHVIRDRGFDSALAQLVSVGDGRRGSTFVQLVTAVMGGIAYLCVGVSAGIGASRVTGAQIGTTGCAVIGGVGALVGGSLVSIAVSSAFGWLLTVVAALIGSISLLFVAQLITEKR